MNRISEVKILSYFDNKEFNTRHGVYQCKFKETDKIFVITNNIVYVLSHYADKSQLDIVREDVKKELFDILKLNYL
jgi:hypothetical protein